LKIAVIGLGRVGLPFSLVLAENGFEVIGIDINSGLIEALKAKKAPFYEPKLPEYLEKHVSKESFKPTVDFAETQGCDAVLITVWTPVDKSEPDLNALHKVFSELEKTFSPGQLYVIKSTVPVGTTRKFLSQLEEKWNKKCGEDFYFAFVPERMIEGKAIDEIEEIPKIIGTIDGKSRKKAMDIFSQIGGEIIPTTMETAEFVKILDNAYRFTNIAIGNSVLFWSNSLGLDSREVIRIANQGYKRNNIFLPGPAGGPCLIKDSKMLRHCVDKAGGDPGLIKEVLKTNKHILKYIVKLCEKELGDLKGKKILVFGAAFKGSPKNDDIKHSPAIPIIEDLVGEGAEVYVFDPLVKKEDIERLGGVPAPADKTDVELALILNNNPDFESIDFSKFNRVIDCWGVVRKEFPGYSYYGVKSETD